MNQQKKQRANVVENVRRGLTLDEADSLSSGLERIEASCYLVASTLEHDGEGPECAVMAHELACLAHDLREIAGRIACVKGCPECGGVVEHVGEGHVGQSGVCRACGWAYMVEPISPDLAGIVRQAVSQV